MGSLESMPQSINAHPRMAGMKRHDFDRIRRIDESDASVGRRESLDKIKAHGLKRSSRPAH